MKPAFITVALLICQFAHAQLNPLTLKGKVKSTTEYSYDWSQNITTPNNNWICKVVVNYDTAGRTMWEQGLLRKSRTSHFFDTLRSIYNKEGRLVRSYVAPNDVTAYSYSRDSRGRIIVTEHHNKHTFVSRLIDEKTGIDTFYLSTDSKKVYKYNAGKTVYNITEIKNGLVKSQAIETYDNQNRKTDQVIIKNGKRESHETINYARYGYTRIDSNLIYVGGPPAKITGNKIASFTYKYNKLDKYGNPLVTSFLYNGKYVVIDVMKIEYY